MAKKPWEEDYGVPTRKRGPWDDYAPNAPAQNEKTSEIESMLSGAGDALTFGWGDELLGLGSGIGAALTGGDFGKAYNDTTNWSRSQQKIASYDNPFWYGGGQLGGAILGGMGIGGAARLGLGALGAAGGVAQAAGNVGAMGRIGTAAATGALGGGIYGAGSEEDNKLGGALEGAAWGGALGGGLRAVGEPLGQVYRSVVKPAFDANYRGARTIAKTLDRFGSTPQKFQDALDQAPHNAVAMDILPGGTQITMGAGTRPSAGKEAMRNMLDERNNAMADEAADMLWGLPGMGPKNRIDAGQRILSLKEAKRGINYDDIDAGPSIDLTSTHNMGPVDFVKHHLEKNGAFKGAIDDALEQMRVGDPNVTGLRAVGDAQWDYHHMAAPKFWRTMWTNVREDVQRYKRAALISGQGLQGVRAMEADARALRRDIGRMLGPKWEAKQAAYKALSDEEEAIRMGYDAVSHAGDINLGDYLDELGQLRKRFQSDSAKEQFDKWVKQGALARVEDMMNAADTQTGRADVLRSIIGNKAKVSTLNNILGRTTKDGGIDGRTGFAKIIPKLEEQRGLFMNSVASGIGVNSHTADKLAAQASQQLLTNPTAGGLKGMIMKGLTGEASDAFDEKVSNKILEFMQKPAAQLKAEIAAAGGVERWMKTLGKDELLALAMQAQKPAFRQNALRQAALGGIYSNIGGDALLGAAGFGQ